MIPQLSVNMALHKVNSVILQHHFGGDLNKVVELFCQILASGEDAFIEEV